MTDEARDETPDGSPGEDGRFTPEHLERAILGGSAEFTAAEISEITGVGAEETARLWRALGFPDHPHERAFTRSDAAALTRVFDIVRTGAIDFDTAVNLTRGMGRTMARLADWEVATLVRRVEEMAATTGEQGSGSRIGSAMQLVEQVNTPFEELLVYAWQRHLAAAVSRVEALGAAEEGLHTTTLTCGFADIVGFTRLSNEVGEERVGDLIEIFESRCSDVISAQEGRVIKSIGDSVLFVNADPVRAFATGEGIVNVVGRDPRMPDVRVGLATGSVVLRLGDVFGPSVNLASRLTTVARRNRIIIDQGTADRLPTEDFETRRLTARPARGFGLVEPVAVRRR